MHEVAADPEATAQTHRRDHAIRAPTTIGQRHLSRTFPHRQWRTNKGRMRNRVNYTLSRAGENLFAARFGRNMQNIFKKATGLFGVLHRNAAFV